MARLRIVPPTPIPRSPRRSSLQRLARWSGTVGCLLTFAIAPGQAIRLTGPETVSGTIRSVVGNRLTIGTDEGATESYLIQPPGEVAVNMGGRLINFPATIEVRGQFPVAEIAAGTIVRFEAEVERSGRVNGTIREVAVVEDDSVTVGVEKLGDVPPPSRSIRCRFVGRVERVRDDRITVDFGRSDFLPRSKLIFPFEPAATASLTSETLKRVVPGSAVEEAEIWTTAEGERFVGKIKITLPTEGGGGSTKTLSDALNDKYRNLSTEPVDPRDLRSAHFLLRTDVSERDARILLEKLERMYVVVSSYLGATPTGLIPCYVVQDIAKWPPAAFDPEGLVSIRNKAGVTLSRSIGNHREAVVYAFHDHGIVQHEAVHALCRMAMGSTGPVWFAEGFAELGYHWDPDDPAVDLDPVRLTLFQKSEVKGLLEITAPGQRTGDSWENYAWRWALCHLLSNNPNYAPRFRMMAVGLMKEDPSVSFESVYGSTAREIQFEYDQFVRALEPGLRVDLTAWDWRTRFRPVSTTKKFETLTVAARRGWQATGLVVEAGKAYDVAAQGQWGLHATGQSLGPEGTPSGEGRLVAAVLDIDESGAYRLSDETEVGARGTVTPARKGQLYLRCRDRWADLADNTGEVTVFLREQAAPPAGQAPAP